MSYINNQKLHHLSRNDELGSFACDSRSVFANSWLKPAVAHLETWMQNAIDVAAGAKGGKNKRSKR